MTEKNKFKIELKYLAFLILVAVISCFSVAGATLSRYITQTDAYFNDGEEVHEYLDFTVNSVFEVKNQMELFAAINQGYSFIRLSQEIENPLIVTQKAETLDSDLILDLNGIEIQRNGYEPILNVKDGVRLTVVDTSDEGTGGLYNPVGSVFNITGGTLTVATGHFESGPRYSEYYSYNTDVIDGNDENNKRTIVLPEEKPVHFHKATITDGKYSYGDAQQINAPIIRSYPLDVGNVTYTHGNLYFDHEYLADEDGDGVRDANEFYIPVDTYCYYRTSEDAINGRLEMIELTCDWYYMYWVDLDFNYAFAELPEGADVDQYIEIAIYGYEKVIEDAAAISNQADYYAAIQMSKGTLEVQDGKFFSYFGVPTTACVNALGGEIDIVKGEFSSRIPNATIRVNPNVATEKIAKKHDDVDAFGDEYFEKYNWNDALYTDGNGAQKTLGALAMAGESYCILNSGNVDVSIGEGNFRSSNNNIVAMQNGTLFIGGGEFIKQSTIDVTTSDNPKAAMVYMANGNLNIQNITAKASGVYNIGVRMINGSFDLKSSAFTIAGDKTYGIYSTVSGDNNFNITDTSFTLIDGTIQSGIRSTNGRVNISSTTGSTISVEGANSTGIYVSDGGSVSSTNYSYILSGENSTGIYSSGGSVALSGGSITLEKNFNCYGIYALSIGTTGFNVSLLDAEVNVGYGAPSTKSEGSTYQSCVGVAMITDGAEDSEANDGEGDVTASGSTISLTNTDIKCHEVGVSLCGGQLTFDGAGSINTEKASAIAVADGNVTFSQNSEYTITSKCTTESSSKNTYDITLPLKFSETTAERNVAYPNTDGIYVEGGKFMSYGTLNVTHTGLQNDTINTRTYYSQKITSYAVRVEGGDVTIAPSDDYSDTLSVTANVGGGVYCGSGKLTIGDKDSTRNEVTNDGTSYSSIVNIQTLGNQVTSSTYHGTTGLTGDGYGQNWEVPLSITGGNAVELNGGSIIIYTGVYNATFGNGILAKISEGSTGSMDVYNGVFLGNMNNNQGYTTAYSGPASSYGIKIIGGAKVNLHDGKYDGKGGGVMVTGSHTYNNGTVSGTTAELYIHKGEYASMSATDGIMIYEYAKVIIGASKVYGDTTDDIVVAQMDIDIKARLCPISCNTLTGNLQSNQRSQVSVYYGHLKYGQAVGWNESSNSMRVADVVLYNTSIYDSTGTQMLVAYEYEHVGVGNYGLGGGVGLDNNTDVKSYVN